MVPVFNSYVLLSGIHGDIMIFRVHSSTLSFCFSGYWYFTGFLHRWQRKKTVGSGHWIIGMAF